MTSLRRLPRRPGLLLVLASLLVYNVNLREISSQDTIPTRVLPVMLIEEHHLNLDRFFRDYPAGRPLPSWVQRVGEHYLSPYPVLPALLAVPVYFLPVRLFGGDSWTLVNLLAKLSATLFAALAVLCVYLALTRLTRPPVAVGIALVYGFGTSTWSISSQGLWGHGPAQLFMAAALYCALRGETASRFYDAVGLLVGLMLASRLQTAPIGATLLAYVLHRSRVHGTRATLWTGLTVLPFLVYNWWTFGSPWGAYAQVNQLHAEFDHVDGIWLTPLGQGLLGLLFSPSRGLFVYSPVLLLTVVGMVLAVRDHRRVVFGYLGAGLVVSLVVLSKYSVWWGGHSFGPRYLTDLLPLLVMFLAPAWERFEHVRPARAGLVVLFVVSLVVQLVGVFYYPSPRDRDWNTSPQNINATQDRLWDWRDTQLLRLLRNGPSPTGFGSIG